MDSLEVNKLIASVLVGGIVFMVAGIIGNIVVHPTRLEHPVIKVEGAAAPTAAAPKAEEALPPIAPLLAKADVAKGEAFAKQVCAVCHTFNEGGQPGIGPNLWGIVGDPHAHEQGYSYSAPMKTKTGTWTYDELNQWLKKPSAFAPGTKMTFAGINNDQQRADVIAWLHTLSSHPEPLPKP
jgi:cytochrome c